MGQEKNKFSQFPAFYAVHPEVIVEQLWPLLEKRLNDSQGGAKWLSIQEVAERVSCSADHVRNLIEDGDLPATDFARKGSSRRDWRVRESDLVNFRKG